MICTTFDCGKKVLAKNLCTKCYYRVKRGGTPELSVKQKMKLRLCSIVECGKSHFSDNYCAKHYKRFKRHGDPNFINPLCNRDGNYKNRHRGYVKRWKKNNWNSYKAYLAARKQRVKDVTPGWADLIMIQEFYRNCPKGYHVDHIIPIHGKEVTGFHVIDNLQYLPALENLKKSNKLT